MKAYILEKFGQKNLLKIENFPIPSISENEVLVEIFATSINPLDLKIKNGDLKMILPYKTPLILGHDVAGKITQIGKNVKNFQIGDEIFARVQDGKIGTFTEFIAINKNDITLKPENLSFEESASIPLVALTTWQIFKRVNLQKGQKIFIQAGSGGLGSFAIQLAKYFGAYVATTVSEKNFEFVKNLGADEVIDYKKENFDEILKDFDVVLHSQDNISLKNSIKILKKGGKIISLSGYPTPEFAKQMKLGKIFEIIMKILSYGIRKQTKKEGKTYDFHFMKADGQALSEIAKILKTGKLRPIIDKIYNFENLNDALLYSESGRAKGKIIVKMK